MTTADQISPAFMHDPLAMIEHAYRLQVELCNALERIADGLPDEVDRRLCTKLAANLQYELPLHHKDEEGGLFPLLRARALPEDRLDDIIDRLESEHKADTAFASEVAESLEMLGRGTPVANAEMLGYMLRGFFECYRRHIHWETVLVMPLARLRLTHADLQQLGEHMARNRRELH